MKGAMPVKKWRLQRKWIGLLVAALLCASSPAVWAEGGYALPGQTVPAETPTEPEMPKETAAPTKTMEPETSASDKKSEFALPGQAEEGEKLTSVPETTAVPYSTSVPDKPQDPAALSDREYMDAITLAFMDNVQEITPENPKVYIRAVMVRAPERRIGSAQWFINGQGHGDYYSSEFPIYNGRVSEIEISVPFAKGAEVSDIDVALEVHLNGAVRRIEKHIKVTNFEDDWYDQKQKERIFNLVKPVEIEATVLRWTQTYANRYLGGANGSLGEGRSVIYTDHYGESAAQIWIPEEGRSCWVPYYSISISDKDYTVYEDFSDEDKEAFVNLKGYESTSPYLIWVNLERQRVNVFQGSKGSWDLIQVSTCSSGTNVTPTPTGVMTYCALGDGWYHDTYYVKPVMYLNLERGIALHSILFSPNGSVLDGTQGRPASHGCVRMPAEDIRQLANFIPIGTTVVVF